jgi:hypothetical protein
VYLHLLPKLRGLGVYLDSPLCVHGIMLKHRNDIAFYTCDVIDILACCVYAPHFEID